MPPPAPSPAQRPAADGPRTIVGWLRSGTVDAPLLATIWLLAEAGVPIVVAGTDATTATELASAIEAFGRPPALLASFPTTIEATSLEAVLDALRRPPYRLTEDATRSVGAVLVLRHLEDGRRRVAAAHYVRPLEQDVHGHVQRRPPALLAAWDADVDRFDDYAWGIGAELAGRVGIEPTAFEAVRAARADRLAGLAAAGLDDPAVLTAALAEAASDATRGEAASDATRGEAASDATRGDRPEL